MKSEHARKTEAYLHVWDSLLLSTALLMQESLDLLVELPAFEEAAIRDTRQMIDVLEDELIRRGLGDQYIRMLLSTTRPRMERRWHQIVLHQQRAFS